MLSDVLKLMTEQQLLSVSEMVQRLGWTTHQIESALAQLESMGYIQKMAAGGGCSTGGCSGCSGCSVGKEGSCSGDSGEAGKIFSWVITKRGKRALQ